MRIAPLRAVIGPASRRFRGPALQRFISGSALVIEKTPENKIATLRMNHGPVNSLSKPFVDELTNKIKELETDPEVNGVVLTSGCKKVFSAGLDLQEIIKPESEKVRAFWHSMQELWLTLYGSPLTTVAAVNGAAPAAGCLLAMSCDYRVMAPDFVIGLNEEALKVGLIDEVPMIKNVESTAVTRCVKMMKGVDRRARHETKCSIRAPAMQRLRDNREADLQWFVDFAMNPRTQDHLATYMESLKARSKRT